MFVDIYKDLRDHICGPNDNKDGCPFDYIGTCPYFIEMRDSQVEINSCQQCRTLIKNKNSRYDIRSREPLYCKECGNNIKDTYYLDVGNNIICTSCVKCDVNNYVQKSNRDCRNNNLDPNSSAGKGYITEILVAKFLGIKTCFDIIDNFHHPKYDLLEREDFGKINCKGSRLIVIDHRRGCIGWRFNTKKNTIVDFFFCIGYNEDMTNVESVFIIPNEGNVCKLEGIGIIKDGHSKWNKFKESQEEVKKWNDLFHDLRLENCPILRHMK